MRQHHNVILGSAVALAFAGVGLSASAAGEKPAAKQPAGFPAPEEPSAVSVELIAEHASIQPGGSTRVGVHFEIEEGWHIYTDPPGDAGMPTTIVVSSTVPEAGMGPWQWPEPEHFVDPGDIRTNGYSGTLVVWRTVSLPVYYVQPFKAIALQAAIKWLACKEICIQGSAELGLSLPLSANPPAASTHAALFEHTD